MDDLTFSLVQLCRRNRDGGYSTQRGRESTLRLIARQLREMGHKQMTAKSLKEKHVQILSRRWLAENLSAGTIKNRMVQMRWWAEKIGKASLFPGDNSELGIPNRQFSTNENKARELDEEELSKVTDAYVAMSLRLQLAFGLRREEAIKFRPSYADRGDHIMLLGSWTKGGLERSIPITTPEQRIVLGDAHELAGSGSLIPAHKTYIQQLRVYEGQCKAARLSRVHGLRHRYAQKRYEVLTGWKAPAAGGPPKRTLDEAQREKDAVARKAISRELGHERTTITNVYLGR
jgi:integrase